MIYIFAFLECLCFLMQNKKCCTLSCTANICFKILSLHLLFIRWLLCLYFVPGAVLSSGIEYIKGTLPDLSILSVSRRGRPVNRQLLRWYKLGIDACLFIHSFIYSVETNASCLIVIIKHHWLFLKNVAQSKQQIWIKWLTWTTVQVFHNLKADINSLELKI